MCATSRHQNNLFKETHNNYFQLKLKHIILVTNTAAHNAKLIETHGLLVCDSERVQSGTGTYVFALKSFIIILHIHTTGV